VHPVLVSGVAQFQLVHIHPFVDGNGRTSRLLSTLCLYRAGYDFKRLFSISEYYDRDRAGFYAALQSVRHNGTLPPKYPSAFAAPDTSWGRAAGCVQSRSGETGTVLCSHPLSAGRDFPSRAGLTGRNPAGWCLTPATSFRGNLTSMSGQT